VPHPSDPGIDAGEIDLLVEPAADPVVTAVGNAREQPAVNREPLATI